MTKPISESSPLLNFDQLREALDSPDPVKMNSLRSEASSPSTALPIINLKETNPQSKARESKD